MPEYMFKVVKHDKNRLDIDISGKLDSNNMKVVLDELLSSAEDIKQGKILYRMENFDIPTLGAIGVELSRVPELFRFIRKFDRIAVLADKNWVKKVGEMEGALIPGLEIKAFDLDEKSEADKWLSS